MKPSTKDKIVSNSITAGKIAGAGAAGTAGLAAVGSIPDVPKHIAATANKIKHVVKKVAPAKGSVDNPSMYDAGKKFAKKAIHGTSGVLKTAKDYWADKLAG